MIAVLDTHIWLDWLVFADAGAAPIARAAERGTLSALGSDETRDEWCNVIRRPRFGLDERAREAAVSAYDRWVRRCPRAPACGLACRDPDDQKFLDLAVAEGAGWLVTRDKALLALARHAARRHRLAIVRPDAASLLAALATDRPDL